MKEIFFKLFHPREYLEQKMQKQALDNADRTGILMHIQELTGAKKSERLLVCVVRGLMFSMIICGTIGCFATALELPASMILVCLFVTALTMFCSIIYYNKFLYNLGLIAVFFGLIFTVFRFYPYINSGWSAITNLMLERLDDLWNLEGYRTYSETIAARDLTTTITLSFVGCAVAIIMNSIYQGFRKMSIFLGASMVVLCVCFFLQNNPSPLWICVMICGYLICYMTILSGHSLLPEPEEGIAVWRGRQPIIQRTDQDEKRKMFDVEPVTAGVKDERLESALRSGIRLGKPAAEPKDRKRHEYVVLDNGTHSLMSAVLMILVCFVLFLGMALIQNFGFVSQPTEETMVRHWINDVVRDYAVNGVFGLFNDYNSNGGVSGGKLGGVRSVSLDFQTDLKVTYVPYSVDRMYLKAKTYDSYYDNSWHISDALQEHASYGKEEAVEEGFQGTVWENETDAAYLDKEADAIASYLDHTSEVDMEAAGAGAFASKMELELVDYVADGLHTPYYAALSRNPLCFITGGEYGNSIYDTLYGDFNWGWSSYNTPYEVEYYGLSGDMTAETMAEYVSSDPDLAAVEEGFAEEYLDYYLEVPDSIRDDLQAFMDANGIGGSKEEVIAQLTDLFESDYLYTYSPGKTPNGQDFVLYFLNNQKKGYCVYFATAATLMLRMNGIPARYVEGYALDYDDLMDGEIQEDENYDDWFTGYNPLGQTAVVEVELTDASAHAWVEVYEEGFGWVPVEFTVSDMESGDYASFWSDFSSLFGGSTGSDNTNNTDLAERGKKIAGAAGSAVVWILGTVVILAAAWFCLMKLIFFHRTRRVPARERLINQYRSLNTLIFQEGRFTLTETERQNRDFVNNYHSRTRDFLIRDLGMPEAEVTAWIDLVTAVSYSDRQASPEEAQQATALYLQARSGIYRKMKFRRVWTWLREGIFFGRLSRKANK